MVDVGPDTTGTLLVKDRSHEGHAPFFETACTLSQAEKAATTDHYQLKPQELPFFDPYESMGLRGKARLCVPVGFQDNPCGKHLQHFSGLSMSDSHPRSLRTQTHAREGTMSMRMHPAPPQRDRVVVQCIFLPQGVICETLHGAPFCPQMAACS